MEIEKKLPIVAAKLASFAISSELTKSKGTETKHLYKRLGLFTAGIAIETLYLDKKGDIFKFTDDPSTNIHMQNYIFSVLVQTIGNSLLFDSYEVIMKDIVNITVAYALAFPVLD